MVYKLVFGCGEELAAVAVKEEIVEVLVELLFLI